MGKPTGFLEYCRREPVYRPVAERLTDFEAVEVPPTTAETREQAARCMDCGTPFCHACGCPLGNLIPEFNDLIWQNRWHDALQLMWHRNPFADITARVCPALCESACVLGLTDKPVAIRQIETALIEWGYAEDVITPSPPPVRHDQRVAVLGSGPAGLAAAYRLNQLGFQVTVYESATHPGGILRYGIPEFKLEKRILDRRLDLMRNEGIDFECGVRIGDDLSYRYLMDRFQAVCLAFGARQPRDLPVPGRELDGIHFAMDYLTAQNKRLLGEPVDNDAELNARDRQVVVIGGGDTGADCLGTALRQGARHVVQLEIMPKPAATRPTHTPWPDWPDILRTSSSHQEGGIRRWSVATRAFTPDSHKRRIHAVECLEVEWTETDGRRQPRDIPGSEHSLPADMVLLALGFTGIQQTTNLPEGLQHLQQRAVADKVRNVEGMTTVPGVFLAGDAAQGASLVVRAFADGLRVADAMAAYLTRDNS